MAGLLLFSVLGCIIWGLYRLVKKIGDGFPYPHWRWLVKIALFTLLALLPIADELIAKYQFAALCKANGIRSVDLSKARGKRVYQAATNERVFNAALLPASEYDQQYIDVVTDEVLITHKDYNLHGGGLLMKYTPISMGYNHPMLNIGIECVENTLDLFKQYGITQVTKINGEIK